MAATLTKKDVRKRMAIFLRTYKKNACNITNACDKANINRRTYYAWLNKYPAFKQAVLSQREEMIDYAESKVFLAIRNGNAQAAQWFLDRQAKTRGYGN